MVVVAAVAAAGCCDEVDVLAVVALAVAVATLVLRDGAVDFQELSLWAVAARILAQVLQSATLSRILNGQRDSGSCP